MGVALIWPSVLPLPTFDGYAIEPDDPILRTTMESGPARQRQLYTQMPTGLPVRWRFTPWQYAIFEAWVAHKAKLGAEYFSITLLGALGMAEHEVRMLGEGKKSYRAVPQRGGRDGVTWIVTATLEARKRPVLTEDALDIVLVEDADGLLSVMDALHALVNAPLPVEGWS